MTNEEIIEQLENTIGLIKQDGKDWLDDRDIPILEACIKSLTALDKIRAEIKALTSNRGFLSCSVDHIHEEIDAVFDKYKAEKEVV